MADFSWVPKELEGRFSYVDGKLMASCEKCEAMRHTSGRGAVLRDIEAKGIDRYRLCGACGVYKGFKPTKKEIASWPEGHKRCGRCKIVKPFEDFHKHKTALFGYNTICKECRVPISRKRWEDSPYERKMFDRARSRATQRNREFTLVIDDIIIPEECPVFKMPFEYGGDSQMAPSIDRIDSSKGYTPDNIQIISWRANVLKNDMTLDDIKALYDFMST